MYIDSRKIEKEWLLSKKNVWISEESFDEVTRMTLYDILEGDSIETIIKQYGVNVLNVLGIVPQLVEENIITVSQAEEVAEAVEPVINSGVSLEEVNESSLSPVILEESFKEIEKSSPFENVQGLKAPNAKNS